MTGAPTRTLWRSIVGALAALVLVVCLIQLERFRSGLEISRVAFGDTPATLYQQPDADGPLVVIAHGFAGARQLMEAFSLTLARSGYRALAFDFAGHGRNPVPMGGDVTAISGTTTLLMQETLRVVEGGAELTGWGGPVALLGHSMASDIIIRAGREDPRVGPIVAVSMFSQAISQTDPKALLAISGQWEARLRDEGLMAVRLVDPAAGEGETVRAGDVVRRAVFAPLTEHVSVLYSATSLAEARDWFDTAYGRQSNGKLATTGPWIIGLLAGILGLGWGLTAFLPNFVHAPPVPLRAYLLSMAGAVVIAPLLATRVDFQILPILVADYLALHLFIYGCVQLAVLRAYGASLGRFRLRFAVFLIAVCLGGFGAALDRYVSSFVPLGDRFWLMGVIALGAVPFMLADTILAEAGAAPFWRRMVLRVAFLLSLGLAVALDTDRLLFLLIILPVIVLFFAVFGTVGRWVGLRSNASSVGVGLGLVLAWSLAATFPTFQP